ncbi:hypothetical protein MTO96_033555, partial [Rhipicephalus appendiculatus]
SKSVSDCYWNDRREHRDSDGLSLPMDRCWTSSPTRRPDFRELKDAIRRLNNLPCSASEALVGGTGGPVEQYASSLESLVEERTADYLEHKRIAERRWPLIPVASQVSEWSSRALLLRREREMNEEVCD